MKYLYFLWLIIKRNPVRCVFIVLCGVYSFFVFSVVDAREDKDYFIYTSFTNDVNHFYVLKDNNSYSGFRVYKSETPLNIKNNVTTINEFRDLYPILCIGYGLLILFLTMGSLAESWEMKDIYRKFYRRQITRHDDIDFTYFVLNGKILRVEPKEKMSDNDIIYNIIYDIDNYRSDKNLLSDFKGTQMEQREKALNEILG